MKKLVLKIDLPDAEAKRKAMKTVAAFPGIDSISIDMKERKVTIIGTVDPTKVVSRLRKYWTTALVAVGPAKEPEKKAEEEAKKDETASSGGGETKKQAADEGNKKEGDDEKKAEEPKKEQQGGGGGADKESDGGKAVSSGGGGGSEKKEQEEEKKMDPVSEMVKAYRAYNPHMTKYYYVQSMEENPNACVIC